MQVIGHAAESTPVIVVAIAWQGVALLCRPIVGAEGDECKAMRSKSVVADN